MARDVARRDSPARVRPVLTRQGRKPTGWTAVLDASEAMTELGATEVRDLPANAEPFRDDVVDDEPVCAVRRARKSHPEGRTRERTGRHGVANRTSPRQCAPSSHSVAAFALASARPYRMSSALCVAARHGYHAPMGISASRGCSGGPVTVHRRSLLTPRRNRDGGSSPQKITAPGAWAA